MRQSKLSFLSEWQYIEVCENFLLGMSTMEIAAHLNASLRERAIHAEITREDVYRLIREARRRGLFVVRTPLEKVLHQRISDLYLDGRDADRIAVVNSRGIASIEAVAVETAEIVCNLIQQLAGLKDHVHLGLAAGYTSRRIIKHLVPRLRTEERLPKLVLHAISAAFHPAVPSISPIGLFGEFEILPGSIEFVSLLAPPFVTETEVFRVIKAQPGVAEAFDRRDEIDIVITGLSAPDDDHATLFKHLGRDNPAIKSLIAQGWCGDVQYRPYTQDGPIDEELLRAFTLFDLDELTALAAEPNRYLVMAASPCGHDGCELTRETALRPLLENPRLRLWSHLVMDQLTAQRLVNLKVSSDSSVTPQFSS